MNDMKVVKDGKFLKKAVNPPPFSDEHKVITGGRWRKLYPCKPNKGSHTFKVWKLRTRWWIPGEWYMERHGHEWWLDESLRKTLDKANVSGNLLYSVLWRCGACGKEALEYDCPEKKFDKYRV
jgi:hypothetical protein